MQRPAVGNGDHNLNLGDERDAARRGGLLAFSRFFTVFHGKPRSAFTWRRQNWGDELP